MTVSLTPSCVQGGEATGRHGLRHGELYALARSGVRVRGGLAHLDVHLGVFGCSFWRGANGPDLAAIHEGREVFLFDKPCTSRPISHVGSCGHRLSEASQVSLCGRSTASPPQQRPRQRVQAYYDRSTPAQRWVHAVLAAWVCPNLIFNYAMAIVTPPGTTATLTREVRHDCLASRASVPSRLRHRTAHAAPRTRHRAHGAATRVPQLRTTPQYATYASRRAS